MNAGGEGEKIRLAAGETEWCEYPTVGENADARI